MRRPKILSDEEILEAINSHTDILVKDESNNLVASYLTVSGRDKVIAQAQREADIKFYERLSK